MLIEELNSHFAKPVLYEVPTYLAVCPIGTLNRKTKRKKAMAKTALNELIDILIQLKIDSTKPDCLTKRTGDYRIGLDKAITEALYLLDKERDQIKQAFENGFECDCMEHENIKEYAKQHLKNKYEN